MVVLQDRRDKKNYAVSTEKYAEAIKIWEKERGILSKKKTIDYPVLTLTEIIETTPTNFSLGETHQDISLEHLGGVFIKSGA